VEGRTCEGEISVSPDSQWHQGVFTKPFPGNEAAHKSDAKYEQYQDVARSPSMRGIASDSKCRSATIASNLVKAAHLR